MEFTLPFPPSVNRYWRMPRALGRPILSREARLYKSQAGLEARRQGVRQLTGDVLVQIDVYRPARRGDIDNFGKVALDSLNGIAWNDDNQIIDLHLRRFDDKTNPRLQVRVEQPEEKNGQHPQNQD